MYSFVADSTDIFTHVSWNCSQLTPKEETASQIFHLRENTTNLFHMETEVEVETEAYSSDP